MWRAGEEVREKQERLSGEITVKESTRIDYQKKKSPPVEEGRTGKKVSG